MRDISLASSYHTRATKDDEIPCLHNPSRFSDQRRFLLCKSANTEHATRMNLGAIPKKLMNIHTTWDAAQCLLS